MSEAVSAMATGVSSSVVTDAALATGSSLTGSTVMVTLALSVPPLPSSTVKVKTSAPLKLPFGEYVHAVPEHNAEPLKGPVTGAVTVKVSPSTSLTPRLKPTDESSVDRHCSGTLATGWSLTGVTVTVITAVWSICRPWPSFTWTVNMSVPWKLVFGA